MEQWIAVGRHPQVPVASVAGNLAKSRPARDPHLAGAAQQPFVKQFTMMTLTFEHEDTKQNALRHDHSLRDVGRLRQFGFFCFANPITQTGS